MLCTFCQEDVRGTPCQTASQAAKCPNNRADDWPDDHMDRSIQSVESSVVVAMKESEKDTGK